MFLKNGSNELIFFLNMCLILGPYRACMDNLSQGLIKFLYFFKHSWKWTIVIYF